MKITEIRLLLTDRTEMPPNEQFLDLDINHIGLGHRSHTQTEPDMVAGQPTHTECAGELTQSDGEHEEFPRV